MTNFQSFIIAVAIDCVWGEWEEWGHCPSGCPAIQNRTRTRSKKVEAANDGKECEGEDFEKKPCSVEQDLKEDINTLKMAKEALEKYLEALKLNYTDLQGKLEDSNNDVQQCKSK